MRVGLTYRCPASLIGLALLTWPLLAFGASTDPLPLDPTSDRVWLTGHLSSFVDVSGGLSLEQIQSKLRQGEFKPVNGLAVSTAFPPGTPTWIHFTVRFPAAHSSVWWLLLTPEILPTLTLYTEQADGHFIRHEGGSTLPFKEREMPGVGYGFKLGEHPGEVRHVFIRMTGLLVTRAEPSLWQEKALIDYSGRFRGFFGFYAGLFSVLFLMALVRALRYRKPLDIAYFLYLLGFEAFNLNHNGFMQVFGMVDSQSAREALIQFGLFLTGFSFLTIARTLVIWPRGSIWPDRLLWGGIATTLLILLWAGAISSGMLMEANFNQAVFWVITSSLMGLWAAWRGYPNARLFTACFLPFVLWAGALSIIRWLEAPLPETFTRYLVLMATTVIHLFSLWYLNSEQGRPP